MLISKRFSLGNSKATIAGLDSDLRKPVEKLLKKQRSEYSEKIHDCYICGGKKFSTNLTEIDRYGLPYQVKVCLNCSHVQTNPVFSDADYGDFYLQDYRNIYNAGIELETFFRDQEFRGREIQRIVEPFLVEKESKKVIDIGCGAGGVLIPFKDSSCEVLGFDFDSKYLEFGKSNYGLDLRFGDPVVKETEKGDLIVLVHVLEHVLNLDNFFKNLNDLLAEGALVYVEVPSIFAIWRDYGLDSLQYFQNAHIHHFTRKNLVRVFRKNGYEPLYTDFRARAVFRKAESTTYADKMSENNAIGIIAWFQILDLFMPALNPIFKLAQKAILGFRSR